jgi:hypothetical protein
MCFRAAFFIIISQIILILIIKVIKLKFYECKDVINSEAFSFFFIFLLFFFKKLKDANESGIFPTDLHTNISIQSKFNKTKQNKT